MNDDSLNQAPSAERTAGSLQQVVLRQWCVEQAIKWSGRPDDQTQTDEMIDQAASIERYVTTGQHSKMLDVVDVQMALHEATNCTRAVGKQKAKAVCDRVAEALGLTQNE